LRELLDFNTSAEVKLWQAQSQPFESFAG